MVTYNRTSADVSSGDQATAAQYNALRTDLHDLLTILFGADSPTDEWDIPSPLTELYLPGAVVDFAGASAPTGWLICDGAAVSRSTYAELFAIIGTTYGAGNGSTTFNLPNAKGKVIVGKDAAQSEFDTLGESGGAKTHTLLTAEMPSHSHTQNAHSHNGTTDAAAQPNFNYGFGSGGSTMMGTINGATSQGNFSHAHNFGTNNTTATNQNNGGGGAHNNLQPYLVMNKIIKY